METELALGRLDDLLAALGHEHGERCSLLREHLEGARWYLVGAMPAEYAVNMRLAASAVDSVGNEELRFQLEDFIRRELSEATRSRT